MEKMNGVKLAMAFDTPAEGGGGAAVLPAPAPVAPPTAAPRAPAPAPRKNGIFDHPIPDSLKRQKGGSLDPKRVEPTSPPAPPAPPDVAPAPVAGEKVNVTSPDGKTILGSFDTQEAAEAFMKERGLTPAGAPAAEGQTFNVLADDNKTVLASFKTRAEAEAYVADPKNTQAAPGSVPAADALPRPIMGRFKTATEVEQYIAQSGQHAQRLFTENKNLKETHQRELADRDAKLVAMEAEFKAYRDNPLPNDLSKEQLTELWKTDPAAAGEYVTDRKLRERDVATAKKAATDRAEAERSRREGVNAEIEAHRALMQKDKEQFPDFEDTAPMIGDMMKMTEDAKGETPLRGHVWAEELLYLAVQGKIRLDELRKGKTVVSDAEKAAAEKARIAALAGAGPQGGGAGKGGGRTITTQPLSKGARIVAAAPRTSFFPKAGKT